MGREVVLLLLVDSLISLQHVIDRQGFGGTEDNHSGDQVLVLM